MKNSFIEMIRQEMENAKLGKPSGIIAKFNNLEDKNIIEALYEASQAGVPIQLIVRGFSCLRPQTPGLSENIHVISIIGPFLEHSRVFYFRSGQANELDGRFYIGSADWMARNLLGRVEVLAPVLDRPARERIWEALQVMLSDQRLAWDMDSSGSYNLRQPTRPEDQIGTHDLLAEKSRLKSLTWKLDEFKN